MTHYNFLDDVSPKPDVSQRSETDQTSETEVELSPFADRLIQVGRTWGVRSLQTGSLDRIIQRAAQEHADYQARVNDMGHQKWDQRSAKLFEALPAYTGFREVAAWSGHPEDQAADKLFEAWRKSPDHWVWVNGPCDFYGYAMAFNERSHRWYGCGIFADRRD